MPGPAPFASSSIFTNTPSSSTASSAITTHNVNGIMNGLASPHSSASSSASSSSSILAGLSAPAGPSNALFPALYLYPLNDTWLPKHIALTGGPSQHVKIGRQTSSKTAPGEKNGFFDSKVLSRQHAEVWEDGGKIFIKDVKSSNGTFINGDRLSSEGHESEPFEMKSDDIVEFGIDIVGEDNKTIIHHKVAARVVCVFNEQDAQVAARAEQHQQQHQMQQHQAYLQQQQQQHGGAGAGPGHLHGAPHPGMSGIGLGGPSSTNGNNNFPFTTPGAGAAAAAQQQQQQQQRRQQLAQQGLGSLGSSMGVGGLRPPGKTGLSFDVILSRLQGEVQKSRETGAELSGLTSAMGDIGDVLGGVLPSNLPPFPAHLPPVRPPPQEPQPQPQPAPAAPSAAPVAGATTNAAPSSTSGSTENSTSTTSSLSSAAASAPAAGEAALSASAVEALQAQLRETQASLASHLEKVRKLEDVLVQHDEMRKEVEVLKERIGMFTNHNGPGDRHRGLDGDEVLLTRVGDHRDVHEEGEQENVLSDEEEVGSEEEEEEDDDARSIATVVVSHELERVDEEDESDLVEGADGDAIPDEDGALPEEDLLEQQQVQQRRREAGHDESDVEEGKEVEQQEIGGHEETERTQEDDEEAERERRKEEDLEVGRPTTPEPTAFVQRRTSVSSPSPLSTSPTTSSSPLANRDSRAEDMYEQVVRLSKQVNTVMALTSSLEAQHSSAQTTIKGLEDKVAALEGMLKVAEEALASRGVPPPALPVQETEPEKNEEEPQQQLAPESRESLMDMISHFKKSVDGQWGSVRSDWASVRADWVSVRAEWAQEREKLSKAWAEREQVWDARQGEWDAWRGEWEERRGEWDGRKEEVDKGLVRVEEGLDKLHHVSASVVAAAAGANGSAGAASGFAGLASMVGGLNHHLANGGLVTPPSPRSQSSDSVGRRAYKNKRRPSGSRGRSSRSRSRSQSPSVDRGEYDDDETLASSSDGHEDKVNVDSITLSTNSGAAVLSHNPHPPHGVASLKDKEKEDGGARSLATPEPSVYSNSNLESEGSSPTRRSKLAESTFTDDTALSDFSSLADSAASIAPSEGLNAKAASTTTNAHNTINLQTAMGVVVLSVAAAAVFWKVKPEAA